MRIKKLLLLQVLVLVAVGLFNYGCNNSSTPTVPNNPAPTISAFTPAAVTPGQQNVAGTITGTNFAGAIAVDMGNGIVVSSVSLVNSTQVNVTFSVGLSADQGMHVITLTAQGGTVAASNLISVNPIKPVAKFTVSPTSGDLSTLFAFDGSDSFCNGGRVVSYQWTFGDGHTEKSAKKKVTHKFTKAGTFSVKLTVENNYSQSSDHSRDVKVEDVSGGGGGGGDGGGGGGGCLQTVEEIYPLSGCSGYGNTQHFTIARVEDGGTLITADRSVHLCAGHQCEVRRVHYVGMQEFLGDIKRLVCRTMTMDHSHQPAYFEPHVGEQAYIVCK